jgi:hypothetical protein
VYRIGGAQAIAALAYGTQTIAPVDKITGPGNAFVAAAKRRVFGKVGIDMIAGPSEILVIADGNNDPDWIALDLLSQAEHDESAQSILITDDADFGKQVAQAVDKHLQTLDRRDIAGPSWRDYGAMITVPDMDVAAQLSDRIAPEHLELCVADPVALVNKSSMPVPYSWAHGRQRRLAIMWVGQTTFCQRTFCTVFQRPVGDGFRQTHNTGAHDARCAACNWACGRNAWPHPRACRPMVYPSRHVCKN